jgi:hypothetical protein
MILASGSMPAHFQEELLLRLIQTCLADTRFADIPNFKSAAVLKWPMLTDTLYLGREDQ